MRAVSLLAGNTAAAAAVSALLHAFLPLLLPPKAPPHQVEALFKVHTLVSVLPLAPSMPAFATGTCVPYTSGRHPEAALSTALAAILASLRAGSAGSNVEQSTTSMICLSAQLLQHSRVIAASAEGASAALCFAVACELALLASAGFRHIQRTPTPSGSPVLTASEAEVLMCTTDAGRVSAFPASQAASLRACAAAIEAQGHAKAALHAGQGGNEQTLLSADGSGRWHLAHTLLHASQCSSLLRRELGLGDSPLCSLVQGLQWM
jgi:hypothetical protein